MLTNEAIKDIEETLGYTFKSKELLSQAFTRSSYAEEDRMHGGKGLSKLYGLGLDEFLYFLLNITV